MPLSIATSYNEIGDNELVSHFFYFIKGNKYG
jgi:hypothetical protein